MNWKFWQASPETRAQAGWIVRGTGIAVVGYLLIVTFFWWWWDSKPDSFDVIEVARQSAQDFHGSTPPATRERSAPPYASAAGEAPPAEGSGEDLVTGAITTSTLIHMGEILLDKPGGYLSNDLFPPGVWMDNVPNWEFGVIVQIRDMSRVMRADLSRSQSQSTEDPDLSLAEGKFFFDNSSWIFPRTEDEYRDGIDYLKGYKGRLSDAERPEAQFYARADNLRAWLTAVETRLGSLSQRLSASVGKRQLDVGLAGDRAAVQSTPTPSDAPMKTSWFEIDDIFYEARGQAWALLHLLRAVERDFAEVLDDKNARVSLLQIVRELEGTQKAIWSPVILNGTGFGFTANHSLVMASYISRANAAIIDLRALLAQG